MQTLDRVAEERTAQMHHVVNTEHLTIDTTTGEVTTVDHIGIVCTFDNFAWNAMVDEWLGTFGEDDEPEITAVDAVPYYGLVDAAKILGGALLLHPVVENLANILWLIFRGQ